MKYLLSALAIFLISTKTFSQSKKQLKKIDKMIKSDKIDLFLSPDIKKIDVVTLVSNGGTISNRVTPEIKRALLRSGVKILSLSAAKERILDIKSRTNNLTVDGPVTIVNSSLVLDIKISDWDGQMNIEIIDLSKDGEIVGNLSFRGAFFNSEIVGPAFVKKIIKQVELNNQ